MIIEIVVILVFLAIAKTIILPFIQYIKYRRYGKGQFVPIIGEISQLDESFKKYDDIEHIFHHQLDEDPDLRLFVVNLGSQIKLRIFDPDLIKEFYMNQQHYIKDDTYVGNIMRFSGQGLVAQEGQQWKNSRRIFSQAFHFEYIKNLAHLVSTITDKVLDQVVQDNRLNDFDPIAQMQEITGRIIIASFFGEDLANETFQGLTIVQALSHILNTLGDQTMSLQYFLFGQKTYKLGFTKQQRQFNRFMKQFDEYLLSKINKKIEEIQSEIKFNGNTSNPSILAQLITSSQIDELSREQLFDDFKTFYLAGMDTTGHLLGMTIYYATQNQTIYGTLQKEIDNNKDENAQGLQQLPYMNAVIKETLRYYGPGNVIFDRIAIKDHNLGDIPIKKGTIVTPFQISTQRNIKYFENPHVYDPSRWLNKKQNEIHPYAYIPFSAGQRNCIGQHLSQLESRIIINKFFKKFEFSCPQDYKLIMRLKFLSEPLTPLSLKLTLRQYTNLK